MAENLHFLLWCVPLAPLLAAGLIAWLPDARGRTASKLATGALSLSCLLSVACLIGTLTPGRTRIPAAVTWFTYGDVEMKVGLRLDPLSASMGAMVAFVALWIFIYATGYMAGERRFGRFFGFLSLFCGAMLMAVYANSLLLLFMAWEGVGLASYLLIGFHYDRPAAAAAAQKAFITTRVGDLAFLFGMIWLQNETGTLLFHDGGRGLLESGALATLAGSTTLCGLSVSAAASLLLLIGAMGKSGQVPLHTWLPDAMEGPTPVSALIHAATLVAAGVFLVARMHPVFSLGGAAGPALAATAWIGGITALFGALVAMAQHDIKRILAYSTISQLGFMMLALGAGGVAAAMFHLIAHAFFKALLFLSAGSVIHGCGGEQDIRRMGGLRRRMPLTFAAHAVGMMSLAGFPFVFPGFWSKEAILHDAFVWPGGKGPFLLAVAAAFLTAFYMTRQVLLVFFGSTRSPDRHPHESPRVMIVPMFILAAGALLLSLIGTPFWPWFEKWLQGDVAEFDPAAFGDAGAVALLVLSLILVITGVVLSCRVYRGSMEPGDGPDPMAVKLGRIWGGLERAMGFDSFYQKAVVQPLAFIAGGVETIERMILVPLMGVAELGAKLLGRITRGTDEAGLNPGFDATCAALQRSGDEVSRSRTGRIRSYLRPIGLTMSVLFFLYLWLRAA